MPDFSSQPELEEWIKARINTASWGKNSKGLDDLWHEYTNGESVIEERDGRVIRIVYGVGAVLWRPTSPGRTGLYLQETVQHFKAGFSKYRDLEMSIGEKCHHEEKEEMALQRAFSEELGIKVQLELQEPLKQSTLLESDSYPGTLRDYRTLVWHVLIPDEVMRDEYKEVQAKKINLWHWRRLPLGVEMPEMNGRIVNANFINKSD